MDVAEHIVVLEKEGQLMADVAEAMSLDTTIPSCPGWTVRDLLRHVGSVHRWARDIVAFERQAPTGSIEDQGGPWPDDGSLRSWFREGHGELVNALRAAPPDLACWSFLSAPTPLAFWARRQAHETTIHRVDLELAAGQLSPIGADFAADGIDELVRCFVVRPGGRLRSDTPRRLRFRTSDSQGSWTVLVDGGGVHLADDDEPADCTVSGSAEEVYLTLWNRATSGSVSMEGDASLMALWAERVKITWSLGRP